MFFILQASGFLLLSRFVHCFARDVVV